MKKQIHFKNSPIKPLFQAKIYWRTPQYLRTKKQKTPTHPRYSTLLGYTQQELEHSFSDEIENTQQSMMSYTRTELLNEILIHDKKDKGFSRSLRSREKRVKWFKFRAKPEI